MPPDWLLAALASGICTGLITYGGIRVELRYMKRGIRDAHSRLNQIKAPAAEVLREE